MLRCCIKDYGWRSWQLSKIPEEKRNRQICLRAIKAEKSNFPDIPEKYRNSDILESLFAHRKVSCFLSFRDKPRISDFGKN